MKSLLASFLAGALLLTAGCNQCDDVEPIVNSLGFILVSPTGQNLIGPAATQYQPTSLSVTFQGQPFDFIVGESLFGREPVGVLQTHCCLTGKGQARFLLRLTSTDTDTIDSATAPSRASAVRSLSTRMSPITFARQHWMTTTITVS